ncbi:MAG: hypothetical protein ACK50J_01540, partial [Planctomyces sp.]
LRKGNSSQTVSLRGAAADVEAALNAAMVTLNNGTVTVQGDGTAENPWQIELSGYNSATPITAEYDFGAVGDVTPDILVTPSVQVAAADVAAGTQFFADSQSITLSAADINGSNKSQQASLLQTRLRTLTSLAGATVTWNNTHFFIHFATAAPAGDLAATELQILSANGFEDGLNNGSLEVQAIPGRQIVSGSAFRYDGRLVTLRDSDIDASDTAAQSTLLRTRLRTLVGLEAAEVTYSSGNFNVTLNTAGSPLALQFVSGNLAVAAAQSNQYLGQFSFQPTLDTVNFLFDGTLAVFRPSDYTIGDPAALTALQTLLDDLNPGSRVLIDASQLSTIGYQITIEGYDPTNPLIVTADYGDFGVLANNPIETQRLIEQRNDAGVWLPLTNDVSGTLQVTVFGTTQTASSSDVYLSPVMTLEKEGPRMVEKPIWADTNGDGILEKTGETDFFSDPSIVTDHDRDSVSITGSTLRDYFLIGHEVLDTGAKDAQGNTITETKIETVQVNHRRIDGDGNIITGRRVSITLRGIDLTNLAESIQNDQLAVDGADGDDRLVAGFLPTPATDPQYRVVLTDILSAHAVDQLQLKGGQGNDLLVGTSRADLLDSGAGDDTVTGGAGIDEFRDASGSDTLMEVRDLNFSLSDQTFTVSGLERDLMDPTILNPINEVETSSVVAGVGIGVFELFALYGGAANNNFAVSSFTKSATLDGTEGSDSYVVTLEGTLSGQSKVYVTDSGTGSRDSDDLQIQGGAAADTLHLDADLSRQEIEGSGTGSFRLVYAGVSTSLLDDNSSADAVRTALLALRDGSNQPLITDLSVTKSGTADAPFWSIILIAANPGGKNPEGKFLRLASTSNTYTAQVSRATVTRLNDSDVAGLLDGRPDIDGMFGRPSFETQSFNVLNGRTGTFRLTYNGQSTAALPHTASASDIEQALEALTSIHQVTVSGGGTGRNPWRVVFVDAVKDSKGNFLPLSTNVVQNGVNGAVLTNTPSDVVTVPMDIADAAATTRESASLANPANYQRVFYDRTAEVVEIHGGGQDDTFISDDSMAATVVYGDDGNDNFLIGRVIKTRTVTVNGSPIEVIDGDDGVTPGVSFNAIFFGGRGNDYFEVNHNIGVLALFGEAGDDTFFLKAQLQARDAGQGLQTNEMTGAEISAGAGDINNNIEGADKDILINYLENNRVEIYGGSGFDTVVVAGTALADTFYIYTDADDRQYLFGAGLKLENIDGIERLALVTGAGDDIVYLYGLKSSLSLLINTGTGNDQVIVGGDQKTFNVTYPRNSAVYTVQQNVAQDQYLSQKYNYNNLEFDRRSLTQTLKEQAWRDFYAKWVNRELNASQKAAVTISREHWNLLEANLAVAMKLYAQA